MRNQFDEQIRDTFEDRLNHIHASDDLIKQTLMQIRKETGDKPGESKEFAGTISPINNRHISNHIKTNIKKAHNKRVMMLVGTVAASLIILSTSIATIISMQKAAITNQAYTEELAATSKKSKQTVNIQVWTDEDGTVHKEIIPIVPQGLTMNNPNAAPQYKQTKNIPAAVSNNFEFEEEEYLCLDVDDTADANDIEEDTEDDQI